MTANTRKMTSLIVEQIDTCNPMPQGGYPRIMNTYEVDNKNNQWLEFADTDKYSGVYGGRNLLVNFVDAEGVYKEQMIPNVVGYVANFTKAA